ncbi:hypothetical protein ABW20_dc0108220 [Dactylellina cionopaga]|nr:hypothetical protein ABW20_dc0108220 [Dactylellina cionopaga]
MPMDDKSTFIQQFLIVEDIYPLNGPSSKDVDMVIDIDGFAAGAYWPHPWGIVPVVEIGRARVHLNTRGMIEMLAVGVMKEYNKETKRGKVGIAAWFGRHSLYNHATTVEVDFNEPQYSLLSTEDDIVQMVALTFALEKVAAMFLEMGVVTTGVNIAIPSREIRNIMVKVVNQRIVPSKHGWSWLAVMEFLRRLKYKMEAEFLDLERWAELKEIIEFAQRGEKKLNKEMVYEAAEVWVYSMTAEQKGCRWFRQKQYIGKQLLKDLQDAGPWEECKKAVHEIREGDYRIRGWPTFLEIGKTRKRLEEAIPRVSENIYLEETPPSPK